MEQTDCDDAGRCFLAAVRGIKARHLAAALNSMLGSASRVHWSSLSKSEMARQYGAAMQRKLGNSQQDLAAQLRQLDLQTLALRAQARAGGCAGWASMGRDAGVAAGPASTTAEIAAEVFSAPVLAGMRQELRDVSRSLLRTEDTLRAAEQRATDLQEHNAALLALMALVAQATVPSGIGEQEFSRPGGWLDRAQRAIASPGPAV